jgi:hypothetical protein
MSYLDTLDNELALAGIPRRRRSRILTEFADHLDENPGAELGEPGPIARQFADELGTRLARTSAYRAFALLAVAGALLAVLFFTGGRTWGGWVGYGYYRITAYLPGWWVPYMIVCFITAQIALAAGSLALLRAWRLRDQPVMTTTDAVIINRRAALALVCGAFTMTLVPATHFVVGPAPALAISSAMTVAVCVLIVALLAALPAVLAAGRLRPSREGEAGDLVADLGTNDARVTPWRVAFALSLAILVGATLLGIRTDDTYDGILRGILDAGACMIGFITLGRYLGLRTAS